MLPPAGLLHVKNFGVVMSDRIHCDFRFLGCVQDVLFDKLTGVDSLVAIAMGCMDEKHGDPFATCSAHEWDTHFNWSNREPGIDAN
mmetsp:Transcript_16566/g.23189  ORF Transcript_16566/g.23189 Transcript_16566/m.23189 type:complete len:86 (+) Transcript_16566:1536-1793(+)